MCKYTDVVNFIKSNAKGFHNCMTGVEIGSALHINEVQVRKFVNVARSNNIPICSNNYGYFYSESRDDIMSTVSHLKSRIAKVENAIDGMLDYIVDSEVKHD